MDREYVTAADAIAHVREQATELVRRVNPDYAWRPGQFEAKTAEVAEGMTRKLALDLVAMGRPDLARKIRIARERSV